MFLGGFSKLQDFGIDELFFLDDLEYLFAFLFQNQNSFLHLVLLLFHLFEFPGELFIDKFSVFELYFLHRDDVQLVWDCFEEILYSKLEITNILLQVADLFLFLLYKMLDFVF